jgi:allantoin racemase
LKILCINPNSSKEITDSIDEICKKYALKDTVVQTVCIAEAPESIENYEDAAISTHHLLKKFKKWEAGFDGFIMACHGDMAVDLLREYTEKPVIGIAEASMIFALLLGHKFSILSLKRKSATKKEDLVRKYAFENRCASIRATGLRVIGDYGDKKKSLYQAAVKAVEEDRAEVLVLGCAGMAGLDKELQKKIGVPVLDGIVCALMLVESLVRYDLKTSKIGKFFKIPK